MCCCKCLVEKHAQNLPTSFAAISKYPLEYRKAIFINLTPKQKVNVWTDRLGKVAGNIKLTKKQLINSSMESVFDFFSKPENLKTITPKKLSFNILTPTPINMGKGTVIDYTIKLFGIPIGSSPI